jgi:hypothetical protein
MKNNNQHVVPFGRVWTVKQPGQKKSVVYFPTQKLAIKYGRKRAIEARSELIIHRPDGRIREKNTYGYDPYPPKG